jgi:hypothetical protein
VPAFRERPPNRKADLAPIPFIVVDTLLVAHPILGVPLDGSKLLKRFKDALDEAKVRRVRFHDLRHSFATRMAAAGVPIRRLQAWLGHRDFATTLRYADYMPSAQEGELELLIGIERRAADQEPEREIGLAPEAVRLTALARRPPLLLVGPSLLLIVRRERERAAVGAPARTRREAW